MTAIAYCQIRKEPHYRRDAFIDGLKAADYDVTDRQPTNGRRGDLLVIWNRYAHWNVLAERFERDGGTVLVAENGYIGAGGTTPKFDVHPAGPKPHHYYALSIGGHNGSGIWPVGDGSRWKALGIELQPWRAPDRGHILICGQRGIGSPTMASPPNWHNLAAARIGRQTDRPVVIRQHPGNDAPVRPLDEDLEGASACVIWSSGSGVKALIKGIPVFYDAPHWICAPGAVPLAKADWNHPLMDDGARLTALERMAWAQWTVTELVSGQPFRLLRRLA